MGNAKSPPYWEPDLAHHIHCPYYADQYGRDVREWVATTEVNEKRHGQLFIFALGGASRRTFDDLEIVERQCGVDLPDGHGGHYHASLVEFILRALEARFPAHEEAKMPRIGLDLFTPRRGERPWFQRFGSMLEEANQVAGPSLNHTFQSYMLLSLLQFSPRKWADLLKYLGRRLPRTRAESVDLQRGLLRDRILEGSVFELRRGIHSMPGSGGHLFVGDEVAPEQLFMCLTGSGRLRIRAKSCSSRGGV